MYSLKDIQLKYNMRFIVNFDGSELAYDEELFVSKEFIYAPDIEKHLAKIEHIGQRNLQAIATDFYPSEYS